ncbi:hypothetical protein Pmani_021861 [Petrolisthes manimaculis]|uniref:AMP-dependent synthetase/ligase domain-containing protein n=1 Tax=Petrolisthes manimaculis TaxID=1843537 RepID=A0AAE1PFK5_9EUCA|nr:hypothetical protein Pmani_021861 [Petrolisthes manimaculis]
MKKNETQGVIRGVQTPEGWYVKATPSGEPYSLEPKDSKIRVQGVTLPDAFESAVACYGTLPCMATRRLLDRKHMTVCGVSGSSEPKVKKGRTMEKLSLGEYTCTSFNEVSEMARNVGAGVRLHGIKPLERVVVFAETRAEWMIAVLGCL